jgi:hypothetical protein
VLACALTIGTAGPARSAGDTTPPVLTTPIKAPFVVGSTITADSNCFGDDEVKVLAHESFSWSATDAGGPIRYSVVENTRGEGSSEVVPPGSRTSFATAAATNWTNDCGGGSWHITGWDVTATDAAGNSTTKTVGGGLIGLSQDTNFVDSPYAAPAVRFSYAGAWSTSSCACWSHGDTHKTSTQGSAAVATVTVPAGGTSQLGLVMAKGPDRGRFRVYTDGVLRGTVDTYAATPQSRVVVWRTAFGAGTHQVKIVNVGTAGRPRIDIDAVLTN